MEKNDGSTQSDVIKHGLAKNIAHVGDEMCLLERNVAPYCKFKHSFMTKGENIDLTSDVNEPFEPCEQNLTSYVTRKTWVMDIYLTKVMKTKAN